MQKGYRLELDVKKIRAREGWQVLFCKSAAVKTKEKELVCKYFCTKVDHGSLFDKPRDSFAKAPRVDLYWIC